MDNKREPVIETKLVIDKNQPIETEIFVSINGSKEEHIPTKPSGPKILPGSISYDTVQSSAERLTAVANANRQWALAHPTDFQLIYGNPIPGYEQPIDLTYPPARRSFLATAGIFAAAIDSGEINLPASYRNLPSAIEDSLRELSTVEGHELPLPALYLTAVSWTKIHGHIMLELFNLIQPVIADVDAFYPYETQQFLQHVGLT